MEDIPDIDIEGQRHEEMMAILEEIWDLLKKLVALAEKK